MLLGRDPQHHQTNPKREMRKVFDLWLGRCSRLDMENETNRLSKGYSASTKTLAAAVSAMVESVGSPEFTKAFWNVQRMSEKCKRIRKNMEEVQHVSMEMTGSHR